MKRPLATVLLAGLLIGLLTAGCGGKKGASPAPSAGGNPSTSNQTNGGNDSIAPSQPAPTAPSAAPTTPPSATLTLTGSTTDTPHLGGTGGTPYEVHCTDQEAIVAYKMKAGIVIDQLIQIGCKNIGALNSPNAIHWVNVKAGGTTEADLTLTAPRGYAMNGFSGRSFSANGGPEVVVQFLPQAASVDTSTGITPSAADPGNGGWALWTNYWVPAGQKDFVPQGTVIAPCPADSVLVGVKGSSGYLLDGIAGICQPVHLANAATAPATSMTLSSSSASPVAIGQATNNSGALDCHPGEVVVAVRGKSFLAVDQIEFGCKGINQLYDPAMHINWTGVLGGQGGSAFEIEAPRGYALTGFHAAAGAVGSDHYLAKFTPKFAPVDATGLVQDAEFALELPAPISVGDPFNPIQPQDDLCPAGSVMTGAQTYAGDYVNSLQAHCQTVVAN